MIARVGFHSILYLLIELTFKLIVTKETVGSGCDSVGRTVDSVTRGPGIESGHVNIFIKNIYLLLTVKKRQK